MYVEQGEMFDGLISAGFTPTQVSALRGIFTQCMLTHVSRGQLMLHGSRPEGATDAVLSLANFPPTGEITNSDEPDSEGEMRNGWALDVIFGAARFGGAVVFDGPVVDNGGTLSEMPIGSVMLWAGAIGSIPTNWALMDGTANASGSGIDMRGQVPYGYSGAGDFATIGGTIAIALTTTFAGASTATTSSDGTHGHSVSGSEVAASITVTTPSLSHSASGTITTNATPFTVDDSPTLSVFDGTTSPDSNYATANGDVTGPTGHNHTIPADDVAATFDSHSATACTVATSGVAADTDTSGAHTHTVTLQHVAAGLSIDTPSVVRPAGKVLAYIEKIS